MIEDITHEKEEKIIPLVVTSSFRSTAEQCPRKSLFAHIYHVKKRPQHPSAAFFGTSLHGGWEHLLTTYKNEGVFPDNPIDLMMEGFNNIWTMYFESPTPVEFIDIWNAFSPEHAYEIFEHWLSVQEAFLRKVEILEVEELVIRNFTPYKTPAWVYGGKLDLVFRWDDEVFVYDHKSTGSYAKEQGFQQNWIDSHSESDQLIGYNYLTHLKYKSFPKTFIDAVLVYKRKTTKHFRQLPIECGITPLQVEAWIINLKRFGNKISGEYVDFLNDAEGTFACQRSNCFAWNRRCSYWQICAMYPIEPPDCERLLQQFPEFEVNMDYIQPYQSQIMKNGWM